MKLECRDWGLLCGECKATIVRDLGSIEEFEAMFEDSESCE